MSIKIIVLLLSLLPMLGAFADDAADFTYNGFRGSNVSLSGIASITSGGLLMLTNSSAQKIGRAFYPAPLQLKNSSSNGKAISFSTTFVFAIVKDKSGLARHGLAFVISPSEEFHGAFPAEYLGLFNSSNNGNSSNHIVAVEFDTVLDHQFHETDDNHVGIDINGLISNKSSSTAYHTTNESKNISLASGEPIQVWIEYSCEDMRLNVTMAPIHVPKPFFPLLSETIDISDIVLENMHVGFSSSTGTVPTTHYVLGWSFKTNGQAQELDLSRLPRLPHGGSKEQSKALTIGLPVIVTVLVLLIIASIVLVRRRMRFTEVLEDWETEYGPHRFSYEDLFMATDGFKEKGLLGVGGFGQVYRGILKATRIEIAVKRVSHDSRQGMREFVAEIVSLGQLRHRNLVQLLGYCRRKGELLLVYEFMSNGSLDRFLFHHPKSTLNWSQRFHILKGVASGLLYLHEEWEQVVVHRDIKASNVLLDSELNGKLSDFGLARLYDHGSNPQTTSLVGTIGYIAPELTITGKATTRTDVFAFGAFMLEVTCGQRPFDPRASPNKKNLFNWVLDCWRKGAILEAIDPKLGGDYVLAEVNLVLKLGLLCSHQIEVARPSMRQVVQFLEGDSLLPELSSNGIGNSVLAMRGDEVVVDIISYPISTGSISEGR